MTLQEMDRRTLLRWLVALSAGAASSGLLAGEETSRVLRGMEEADVDALKDLGKRYETDYEEDRAGIDRMTELLSEVDFTDERFVDRLRQEMSKDYSSQRTANLYGWFVARTEARVFAAISRLVE